MKALAVGGGSDPLPRVSVSTLHGNGRGVVCGVVDDRPVDVHVLTGSNLDNRIPRLDVDTSTECPKWAVELHRLEGENDPCVGDDERSFVVVQLDLDSGKAPPLVEDADVGAGNVIFSELHQHHRFSRLETSSGRDAVEGLAERSFKRLVEGP